MQQIATPQASARTTTRRSVRWSTTKFTQRFAIGAAVFYTLLFLAALVATPELAGYAVAWSLWIIVMVAAATTYAAGRSMRSESVPTGYVQPSAQSHRMRRWLKSG